ncbi:N-terminal domain of NEFA-interacting nuclear protein NIP30-domain-containing protein [Ustulina deusta]|nr:N-terminal domain of NEFA-interacting nuclear protein NIP30-domain-containing protein [Ustulina deusta]
MTSRFVSGGIIAGDEDSAKEDTGRRSHDDGGQKGTGVGAERGTAASVEWEAVQKDLEEERRRRAEARKRDVEGDGEKSLYEILQANKAAKQAAFEEQNRIRNQFRALDDDEIEFLHGVSDERRAEEERVRRETEEGLASFRKAQQAVGGSGADDTTGVGNADRDGDVVAEEWGAAAGRKRKREREKAGLKGVRRKTSIAEGDKKDERNGASKAAGKFEGKDDLVSSAERVGNDEVKRSDTKFALTSTESEPVAVKGVSTSPSTQAPSVTSTSNPKPSLGLVDYGSDEDDDD